MEELEISVFFVLPERQYFFVKDLLADPAMRQKRDEYDGEPGGIIIRNLEEMFVVNDDFWHVVNSLTQDAPDKLEAGEAYMFEFRYQPRELEFRPEGDMVIIDDQEGKEITAPLADVVAGLRNARVELTELQALVGQGA